MAEDKEGVDYKMVPVTDGKGNPVKDGKGKPVMSRKFFTKAEKAAMSAPKKEAAPTQTTRPKARPAAKPKAKAKPTDIAKMAEDVIDRSSPTRPRARPGTTRPQARSSPGPDAKTSTSAEAPMVTQEKLGRGRSPSPSGSTGKNRFQQTPSERVGGFFNAIGDLFNIPKGGLSERERKPRNYNKGGMVKESGYAKGGMVKANCGASMKPTQKSSKGK
jgi:hypothetical protein